MASKFKSDGPHGDGASLGKIFIGGLPKDTTSNKTILIHAAYVAHITIMVRGAARGIIVPMNLTALWSSLQQLLQGIDGAEPWMRLRLRAEEEGARIFFASFGMYNEARRVIGSF